MPIAATTTKLNITSTATAQPGDSAEVGPAPQAEPILGNAGDSNGTAGLSNDAKSGAEKLEPEQTAQSTGDVEQTASQHPNTIASTSYKPNNESASWLAWFSKTNAGQSVDQNSSQPKDAEDSTHASADGPSQQEDHEAAPQQAQRRQSDPYPLANSNVPMITPKPSSWFGLWNNAAVVAEKGEPSTSLDSNKPSSAVPTSEETTPKQTETPGEVSGAEIPKTATIASSATKSSGWAFWSRDTTRTGEMPKSPKEDTGELAVADTPSQSSPTIATAEGAAKLGTQERPKSLGVTGGTVSSREPGKKSSTPSGSAASRVKLTELVASKQLQKVLPNLVLPTFESTYRPQEHATLLQQLGRFLQYNKSPVTRHVSIARDKPRIKKALAIGVHGYFPVPLIRSVLGQPTGTSIRFASSAASAIKKWTESHGYACEIEKIALEGEGKVAERVELLWKLLLNWIEEIRKADFVMIACHSQGVPVAMMLVARLIAFGCVNGARVGVCAMAGVNLGPFSEYKSRWISGSAGELFDFSRPDSKVSKDYLAALQTALQFGVRIVYIGSIDDQLVSLEVGPDLHTGLSCQREANFHAESLQHMVP